MPGLSRDMDPEATARRLARSASSTGLSASKQPPPRAPRSARRQPAIDEDPRGQAGANRGAPSPCAAAPPPRAPRSAGWQPAIDEDPGEQAGANRAAASPSAAPPPPRMPRSAGRKPAIDEDLGEQAGASRAAPSSCSAPPPRTLARPTPAASALDRVTGVAPPLPTTYAPVAPRSDRRQLPRQMISEDAVKKASEKLAAPSPCPASASRPPFGAASAPRYATTPSYYAPALPHASRAWSLFPRPYVPAASAAAVLRPAMQPQQRRHAAEAALARTQLPMPYAPEGVQAATGLYNNKGEDHLHNSKEHPLRIRVGHAQNPRKLAAECHISNPTEQDINESIAAFATKTSDELDVIKDVLLVLPKAPRSIFCCNQSLGGGDSGGDGTNSSTLIHTERGTTGSTASVEVIPHDISIELARFGSVRSSRCKTIWEKEPLILHDADIVHAAKAINVQVDMMKRITSILQSHPGPVKYFRVDSSDIKNGMEQLEEWFNILRKKAVEEVVIVNSSWPDQMIDFPINDLDCESLKRIRICFFRISDTVLKYVENLSAIDLSCCSITSQDLYALVSQSKNLKELDIGLYKGDAIRLNSKSLEVLLIWHSTVQNVSVQNALKLRKILVAARAKKSCVGVWIGGAHVLTDVWLNVSTQSIAINNISTLKDVAPLHSLRRLVLNISLQVKKERFTLINLMKSCTALKELTLWRNDATSDDEGVDAIFDDWPTVLKDLSCLKLHLEVFNIKNFKGGDIEIAIAAAILENGSCLKQLTLEADVSCHDDVFDHAKIDLQKILQVSVRAVVNYVTGQSDCSNFFFEEV